MSDLVRTTITIPESIYNQIKILAAYKGKSVSSFVTEVLNEKIKGKKILKKKIDPMSTLGVFSLGGKEPYKHREELYDDYLKEKMGL